MLCQRLHLLDTPDLHYQLLRSAPCLPARVPARLPVTLQGCARLEERFVLSEAHIAVQAPVQLHRK